MAYTAKDYSALIGLPGFSETLLKNHFTLYQGYVTNTNKVLDTLDAMLKDGKAGTPEYAELKRRLGWEFDGMRLHEYLLREPRREAAGARRASWRRRSPPTSAATRTGRRTSRRPARCGASAGRSSTRIRPTAGS